MINQLIAFTKSNAGALSGIWKSKRYSLTLGWATVCVIFSENIVDKDPNIALHALWIGSVAVVAYILGESFMKATGVKAICENGDTSSDVGKVVPPKI